MSSIPTSALADQAREHLGEAGPRNTCLANGPERWTVELGLEPLGTASVTEAIRLAKAGHNGYRYHDGTDGLAPGHIGVWTHDALRSTTDEHVTVVVEVQGNLWRGIGSGTPSGKVAWQPAGGGLNPKSVLRGYIVAPTAPKAPAKPPAVKAPTVSAPRSSDYHVKAGDYLARIARQHGTTVPAILKANPPRADHRSADYHIARANLIVVGQRIRIP